MGRILAGLALAALLAPAAAGQDIKGKLERFELFNACRPMDLAIESLSDDADKIALSRESLQAAAESRLRAARLYTEDMERTDFASLYVNVSVVGPAYSISVEYEKMTTDAFGETGFPTTWESRSTGTYGKDAGYIVSNLSRHLDRFLAAYLRVNESACGSPSVGDRTVEAPSQAAGIAGKDAETFRMLIREPISVGPVITANRCFPAAGTASAKACPSTLMIVDQIEIQDVTAVPAKDNPPVA